MNRESKLTNKEIKDLMKLCGDQIENGEEELVSYWVGIYDKLNLLKETK